MSSGKGVGRQLGQKVLGSLAVLIAGLWAVQHWLWPLFLSVLPTLGVLLGVGGIFYASIYYFRYRRQRL